MTRYGYCRISTVSQEENTSFQNQSEEILRVYPDAELVFETFSGAKKRKKLDELIEKLQPGDLVCSTKLDRFCRSVKEGLEYVDRIREKGAAIHILSLGLMDDSPTGKMILTIFLGFAEFERALIVQRCKEGKEIAKQNPNFRDGRPRKFSREQIEHAISLTENFSLRQVENMTGISVSTIKRYKRKMKINGNEN